MTDTKIELLPCPFCGGVPYFTGDTGQWLDANRYIELNLVCCATMSYRIGWRRARDMTVDERTAELKSSLTSEWNKREGEQND